MNLKITKTKRSILKTIDPELAPTGSESTYIQISRSVGAKLFDDSIQRDYTYNGQKFAYVNGFGPNVGQRFVIKIKGRKYYSYITEHAGPATCDIDYTEKDKLLEVLEKHGWAIQDYKGHEGDRNLGLIKGKLVCVDFGPMSRNQFL